MERVLQVTKMYIFTILSIHIKFYLKSSSLSITLYRKERPPSHWNGHTKNWNEAYNPIRSTLYNKF